MNKYAVAIGAAVLAGAAVVLALGGPDSRDRSSPVTPPTADTSVFMGVVGSPAPQPGAAPDAPGFVPVTVQGMEWLNSPPPNDVETAKLVSSDERIFVGVVYAHGTAPGERVSSRIVAMTKPGVPASTLEGVVLEDPQGKKHNVSNGAVISYVAPLIGAWKLIDKGGTQVADCKVEMNPKDAELRTLGFPAEPIVCEAGSAIDVPGKFDGDLTNTRIDKGVVIAENSRGAIVATNAGLPKGKSALTITEGGVATKVNCYFVTIKATGTQELRIGDPGVLNITLSGFHDMTNEEAILLEKKVAVRWSNQSAEVITFGKSETGGQLIDLRTANRAGEISVAVPFKSIAAGVFNVNTWSHEVTGGGEYCQGFQCCSTACAPCKSSWGFCNDAGMTNCSRIGGKTGVHCTACRVGICKHIGSSACGHWWCACPFGFCAC